MTAPNAASRLALALILIELGVPLTSNAIKALADDGTPVRPAMRRPDPHATLPPVRITQQ